MRTTKTISPQTAKKQDRLVKKERHVILLDVWQMLIKFHYIHVHQRMALAEDGPNETSTSHVTNQAPPPSPIRKATGRVVKKPQPTIRQQVQGQRVVKDRRADDHSSRQEFVGARSRMGPSQNIARLAEGNNRCVPSQLPSLIGTEPSHSQNHHRAASFSGQRPPTHTQAGECLPTPVPQASIQKPAPNLPIHLSSRRESAASGQRQPHQATFRHATPAATGPVSSHPTGPPRGTRTAQSQPAVGVLSRALPLGRPSSRTSTTSSRPTTATSTQQPKNEIMRHQQPPHQLESTHQWHRLPPAVARSSQLSLRSSTPRSSSTAPTSSDPILSGDDIGNGRSYRGESSGVVQPFHQSRTQHQVCKVHVQTSVLLTGSLLGFH